MTKLKAAHILVANEIIIVNDLFKFDPRLSGRAVLHKIVLFCLFMMFPAAAYGQDLTELYSRQNLDQIKAYHQSHPEALANINKAFGSRGDTALCAAARRNSAGVVDYLIGRQADPCYARTSDKATPLMIAAGESQHPEVVDLLARAAAQKGCLDVVDRNGNSALMQAARKTASADIVRRLMENNVDPNLENSSNANAHYLIRHNKNFSPLDSIVRELADYAMSYTPSPPRPIAADPPSPVVTGQPPATPKPSAEDASRQPAPAVAPPVAGNGRTAEPTSGSPPRSATPETGREQDQGSGPPPVLHSPQAESKPGSIKIDIDGMQITDGFQIKVDPNPPMPAQQRDPESERPAPQGLLPVVMIFLGIILFIIGVIIIRSAHIEHNNRNKLIRGAIFGSIGIVVFMLSPYRGYLLAKISAPDWIVNNLMSSLIALAAFSAWLIYPYLKDLVATADQGKIKKDAPIKEKPDISQAAMADKINKKTDDTKHDGVGLH